MFSFSIKNVVAGSVFLLVATLLLTSFLPTAHAVEVPDPAEEMVYFYTDSCPFCQQQGRFLAQLQDEFPELKIARFDMTDRSSARVLSAVVQDFPEAAQFQGSVPLTFYQDRYFAGFNEQTAQELRRLVASAVSEGEGLRPEETEEAVPASVTIPFFGEVETASLSAPILATVLGIVDGFNVCSVGALILILSIVLKFRDRRLIIIYGSIFLAVTASMYLLLIFAWYKLFQHVAPYLPFFEVVVGLLAIAGGIYFMREFIRFQRYGVTCESGSNKAVTAVTNHLQNAVAAGNRWKIALAIAVFAAVVTLIEFPCSAAIPLTLAATLVTLELSVVGYVGSMLIFIFFYLLMEIIVFLTAVFSMRIWVNSSGFVKYASLVGALVLFAFGLYYIFW